MKSSNVNSDPLSRPLVFGDLEQIAELKRRALKAEWDALENCPECCGEYECSRCGRMCEDCGETGKLQSEVEKFEAAHPGVKWFQIC